MHPSGCVNPRQGRKNWVWAHQRSLFFKFGAFRRLWSRSFLSYRIFLDLSLAPSESSCKKLQIESFSTKSLDWISRYHHFCKKNIEKSPNTFATICLACCSRKVLLFDRESNLRLYWPCGFYSEGPMHPSGCASPQQGWKNLSLSSPEITFLKFGAFRRLWSRSFLSYRIFLDLSLAPSESSCKKL